MWVGPSNLLLTSGGTSLLRFDDKHTVASILGSALTLLLTSSEASQLPCCQLPCREATGKALTFVFGQQPHERAWKQIVTQVSLEVPATPLSPWLKHQERPKAMLRLVSHNYEIINVLLRFKILGLLHNNRYHNIT